MTDRAIAQAYRLAQGQYAQLGVNTDAAIRKLGGSFDLVLVARARIGGVKVQAVEKDLLVLAAKAGILKDKR